MKNKDYLKINLLAIIFLSMTLIIQLYVFCRIVTRIINTFIYLTGLVTLLFAIVVSFSVLGYLCMTVKKYLGSSKRMSWSNEDFLHAIIRSELKVTVLFLLINLILHIAYLRWK